MEQDQVAKTIKALYRASDVLLSLPLDIQEILAEETDLDSLHIANVLDDIVAWLYSYASKRRWRIIEETTVDTTEW